MNNNAARGIIDRYGLRLKQRYGQNFLTDPFVLRKIIRAADPGPRDGFIEVGPGVGALTAPLCELAGRVVAVEIDADLIPALKDTLDRVSRDEIFNDGMLRDRILREGILREPSKIYSSKIHQSEIHPHKIHNAEIIAADIMRLDASELAARAGAGLDRVKLCANLPYNIATAVVTRFLAVSPPLASLVVMLQKEAADRFLAVPGGKDYGALTVAADWYADCEIIAAVPRNCFIPKPGVDSAVVRFTPRRNPYAAVDRDFLFSVVRAAFASRRKTLVNSMALSGFDKAATARALAEMDLPPDTRGETLPPGQFARLAAILARSACRA
ncbi:MAG: 16S rRNA (adenine(1518)-N(6)/adenine(1519)-N(6))-dimethyltransferase [Clostridiales bacterium]|jgi:16S rRNA (adenine1518-N6/adenine1519-N6)-dimethyltransferase|nr:16S rRNA (adenine(1518)-N(6)/adenine(1519)-N(6))-dimethyltransferase [Clostridiales bacterium]